jgi:hypothetical protein
MSNIFFSKSVSFFLYYVEKYRRAAGQAADGNMKGHMRIACWITKATNTHSRYIILIAFPLQQWLEERT